MTYEEALRALGLRLGASEAAIKEAYRDMAKVWHPDRFPGDERLRRKAQEELKHINEAYRILSARRASTREPRSGSAAEKPRDRPPPPPWTARAAAGGPTQRSRFRLRPWMFIVVAILGTALIGYFATEPTASRGAARGSTSALPTEAAPEPAARSDLAGPGVRPDAVPDTSTAGLEKGRLPAGQASRAAAVGTRESELEPSVRQGLSGLSAEERSSIEAACEGPKLLEGPAAYRRCLGSQLASLAQAPRPPDLSGLSAEERSSIESVCERPKQLEGPAAYRRCLASQLASLARGPRRPDLAGLSAEERRSIESACEGPKLLDGPAAFHRCLASQLASLVGTPRPPDLSGLSAEERSWIESACEGPKQLEGPVAYHRCLHEQLGQLDRR
jgi:hypothetical protein